MTNGELLIKMFPKIQVIDTMRGDFLNFTLDGIVGNSVEKKWWNREYDGGISDIQSKNNQWIPVTYRPMTDEEKKDFAERTSYDEKDLDFIMNCPLPEDGETVLITDRRGHVEVDTFINECDGCYFEYNCDMEDVKAWMPLPSGWKGQDNG